MARGLLVCLLTFVFPALAGAWTIVTESPHADPPVAFDYATAGPVSLAQATELAVQRFPGQVVRAQTVMRSGRREHSIRILGADGRVRTVRIDAETGNFL
jgi:uncharacterized membrane protein YkoI